MLHNFIMSGSLIGSAEKFAKGGGVASKEIKKRLEEIRKELRAEKISYGELAELQSLKKYIDPSDVELLEAAGVPEKHEDGGGVAKGWTDADLMAKGGGVGASKEIKKRLEEIRKALRAENISYGELAELQSLKKYIEPNDVELLEPAGVPEFD